ncbi:hypothetical protein VPH35_102371 [Triticum aestivum]|uniref:Uncharacterized protein n=1 Tax=Triticum turgidum subsp. durum TaxID=4567 RepID=A0A9R1AV90_TRITD|nr:unnamed protein product [Triticum turgidum subsp. durum]
MFKGGWRICLTDARLLRSLSPIESLLEDTSIHIDICTAAAVDGSNIQGTTSNKLVQVQPYTSVLMPSKYRDAFRDDQVAAVVMRYCPKIQKEWLTKYTCFIKVVMHRQDNRLLELEDAAEASTSALILPKFIRELVTPLHVYDNLSIFVSLNLLKDQDGLD